MKETTIPERAQPHINHDLEEVSFRLSLLELRALCTFSKKYATMHDTQEVPGQTKVLPVVQKIVERLEADLTRVNQRKVWLTT